MRRRDFLRSIIAGTAGAFLGTLPRQLAGPASIAIRELHGAVITFEDSSGLSFTAKGPVTLWLREEPTGLWTFDEPL